LKYPQKVADDPEFLTVRQVADKLLITPSAVRAAMTEGRLPFTITYGLKIVHRADLDDYINRTRGPDGDKPRGRPPKKKP